jgi:hypothetical protein
VQVLLARETIRRLKFSSPQLSVGTGEEKRTPVCSLGSGIRGNNVEAERKWPRVQRRLAYAAWRGAFGNDDKWIHAAILRALEMVRGCDLEVKLVTYATPSQTIMPMAKHFG